MSYLQIQTLTSDKTKYADQKLYSSSTSLAEKVNEEESLVLPRS